MRIFKTGTISAFNYTSLFLNSNISKFETKEYLYFFFFFFFNYSRIAMFT